MSTAAGPYRSATGTGTALPYRPSRGPSSTTTPTIGVTLSAQQLAAETGADLDRATRILGVVVESVEEYAPAAPPPLLNEACIRFGGYLLSSGYGAVRSESLGPQSFELVTNHAAAFRNSGAAALLTRYKRRRAGLV